MVTKGAVVSVLLPNIPAMYEAHFGVPMAAAVLHAVNIRLDGTAVAKQLGHAQPAAIVVDSELLPLVVSALRQLVDSGSFLPQPLLVVAHDTQEFHQTPKPSPPPVPPHLVGRVVDYEAFLGEGDPSFEFSPPSDEWDSISLNYTSGTTSDPKGVLYHHRGAFLNALSLVLTMEMRSGREVMLWTLPMFHCNGWCFPWAMAAVGGTNVCLRSVVVGPVYEAIRRWGVTLLCGAPTVLIALVNAPEPRKVGHKVRILTAGAPPPPTVLSKVEELGFEVTHGYGLTEVYGPVTSCVWKEEWEALPPQERAKMKARQGVGHLGLTEVKVVDPETMDPVEADGRTMGEIVMKGHTVMSGYLRNPRATEEAFKGGYFHSGDLAVMHPDGYVEIKDRAKDIIISGGENISSVEVEAAIYKHAAVLEVAVVARSDEKWGESPCAFVTLKDGVDQRDVTEEGVKEFCRRHLSGFMMPKTIVFDRLPKTSTGKIQKNLLRERAKRLGTVPLDKSTSRL